MASWSILTGQVANGAASPLAYPGNCTQGNLLILVMRSNLGAVPANTSVNDSLGNTWVQAIVQNNTATQALQIWYVLSCKSTGSNSVTITGSNGIANAVIAEFSPGGGIASVDGAVSSATAVTTTPTPGNINPTKGTDLVIGGCMNSSAAGRTVTAGSGFTIPANGTSGGDGGLEYALNQPAGTYNPSFTISGAAVTWMAGAIAFSSQASGSGGQGNSPLGNVIVDLDSDGFPIAELQTGTLA